MFERLTFGCAALFLATAMVSLAGCGNSPPPVEEEEPHAHEHGAHEELGPSGGHLLAFDSGPYAAEWLHDDDTDTITVFILDAEGKTLAPVPVESVVIEVKLEGLDADQFILPAIVEEDAEEGAEPAAENAEFQLSNPQLLTGLKMEEGATNSLILEVDGATYSAPIVHHAHDHGHSHSH